MFLILIKLLDKKIVGIHDQNSLRQNEDMQKIKHRVGQRVN